MTDLKSKVFQDLNPAEKSELIAFTTTTYYPLICKLMENMIHDAKDIAMAVDPANGDEQRARMTEAHAMSLFYVRLIKCITKEVNDRMGEIQEHMANAQIHDQEFIEDQIIKQVLQ